MKCHADFLEKVRKHYFKMTSAENFAQHAKRQTLLSEATRLMKD